MLIQRHSVNFWLKNKTVDFSIKTLNGNVAVHRHEFYEIELILEGSGVYNIDGINYNLSRGSLFAMSPISFHHINFTSDTKLINLMFTYDSCNIDFLSKLFVEQPHFVLDVSEKDMDFFKMLADEATERLEIKKEVCTPFLVSLLDCYLGKITNLLNLVKPCAEDDSIQYAILFMHNNFTKKISLQEVAKIANYSPNYFCNRFKEFTGDTFINYLNDLRFSFAEKLLKNTKISVSEIAVQCGFKDFSYFMKSFKSRYGVTPKTYRNIKFEE